MRGISALYLTLLLQFLWGFYLIMLLHSNGVGAVGTVTELEAFIVNAINDE